MRINLVKIIIKKILKKYFSLRILFINREEQQPLKKEYCLLRIKAYYKDKVIKKKVNRVNTHTFSKNTSVI